MTLVGKRERRGSVGARASCRYGGTALRWDGSSQARSPPGQRKGKGHREKRGVAIALTDRLEERRFHDVPEPEWRERLSREDIGQKVVRAGREVELQEPRGSEGGRQFVRRLE